MTIKTVTAGARPRPADGCAEDNNVLAGTVPRTQLAD